MASTLVRKLLLQITADDGDAKTKLDAISAKAEELKTQFPELKVKLDTAEAQAKMAVLREELKKDVKVKVDADTSLFRRALASLLPKGLAGGTGSSSSFLSGIPVIGEGLSSAGLPGIVGAGAGVASLLTLVDGVVSGFAAAGAGLGAFGILSAGTFSNLKQDASQYATLLDTLNTKQNVLSIAQANYAADPTKANKSALASAQKAVATAQTNLQAAQMGMGQDAGGAAKGVNDLRLAYDKMSASFAPTTFKVINDALKIANTLLPALKPFADAAGGAIDGLLKKAEHFFQSADFKKWLGQFEKLVGPSMTAIGDGIGKVIPAVGKLFTLMSSKDVVHALNITFDIIAGLFKGLGLIITGTMLIWDGLSSHIASFARRAEGDLANWAQVADNIVKNVTGFFDRLPGDLEKAGISAIQGLWHGIESMGGWIKSKVEGFGKDILNALASPFGIHFSEPSEATQVAKAGMQVSRALGSGIAAGRATAAAQARALGHAAFPVIGGAGGYGGGPGTRIQLEFVGADTAMTTALKKMIRVRGGNPAVIGA